MDNTNQSSTISQLLGDYVLCFAEDHPLSPEPDKLKKAVQTLSAVFDEINKGPTQEDLMKIWNFFVEHNAGILHENIVTRGTSALDASIRMNFMMVYSMFKCAVVGAECTPDFAMLADVLHPGSLLIKELPHPII